MRRLKTIARNADDAPNPRHSTDRGVDHLQDYCAFHYDVGICVEDPSGVKNFQYYWELKARLVHCDVIGLNLCYLGVNIVQVEWLMVI